MDILTLFRFIAGLALLILGGESLVRGASRLASAIGISPLVIGLTVVAIGTAQREVPMRLGSKSLREGRMREPVDGVTIVILVDALGYELAAAAGFEPEGLPNRVRLKTVLGFSQAALASIFTGLVPSDHGLWMMYSFAGDRSPFGWLRMLPPAVSAERRWLQS